MSESIEVKVGQRWQACTGFEFRIVVILNGFAYRENGDCWPCKHVIEHFALLPPRPNEYVQGEEVIVRDISVATYICELPEGSEYRHVIEFKCEGRTRQCVSDKCISRPAPKPKLKWVVPTQADLEAAEKAGNDDIPCKVRDVEVRNWSNNRLRGICVFGVKFVTIGCCWKFCIIQVPESDPRAAVEGVE